MTLLLLLLRTLDFQLNFLFLNPTLTNHIFSDSVSKILDNFENFGSVLSFSENFEIFSLPPLKGKLRMC